jgi:hypothetical protein
MPEQETNADAIALQALVWTLGDSGRASRLLDLTGLDPAGLRARAGEPALLAATLGFLESYEPDLLACADALDVPPARLVAARQELERA